MGQKQNFDLTYTFHRWTSTTCDNVRNVIFSS